MYAGFPRELLEKVKCPFDGGDLGVREIRANNEKILEAEISCSSCPGQYSLCDGILDLLRSGPEITEEMRKEIDSRDVHAQEYDDFTDQPWYELEIPSTMEHLADIDGKMMIEFGSGTGRITLEILKKAAGLIAVDFSRSSHIILSEHLSEEDNIGLVFGDVTKSRFAPGVFDIAVSTQLLEHIPSKELRHDFLRAVDECLKPDGYFLCTAYYYDLRQRFWRHPKEGFHESGIFYHYFNKKEIREQFSRVFEISDIHTFLSHFPKIWRLQFTMPWLIKFFEKTPFFREFGSLILVKAVKKSGGSS